MASFHAELHLAGTSYRVVRAHYACHQPTDARGRVCAKVRHDLLQLTLDVPDDDALLAWAAAPFKALAGQVVFYDAARRVAHETIAFAAGQCVGYHETFESGAGRDGAYVCQLAIAAPAFELRSGGPTALAAAIGGGGVNGNAVSSALAVIDATASAGSGVADAANNAAAVTAAAAVARNLIGRNLLAEVKAANPTNGQSNCADVATALIARLHGTDPNAVARDTAVQFIPDIEATHSTTFAFGHDFHQAFDIIRNSPEGTIGLLVTVPKVPGTGHVVAIVNNGGVPTILEGQHWDAYNPVEVLTSSTRAERRYGNPDKVHVGLAIVPPPTVAVPPSEPVV